jgi:hypothetical protein
MIAGSKALRVYFSFPKKKVKVVASESQFGAI